MRYTSVRKSLNLLSFTVNEGGLPVLAEGHLFENAPHQKPKQRTGFIGLSIEQHREALSAAFGDKPIRGFEKYAASHDDCLRGNRV